MFNWFGRRYKTPERYPTWDDIPPPEYPKMPEVTSPNTEINDDGYTVGPGNDGFCTIMKMKSGNSTITMQMTEDGARKLIKLLESTLPDQETEQQ